MAFGIDCVFFSVWHNEEDYVHPALCGVHIFRKAIQLMRAKHFLNAVQRAGEHRRVLAVRCFFFNFQTIVNQIE